MGNKVNPLDWRVPIANSDGTPTQEFQRKWEQQAVANGTIPDVSTAAAVSAIIDKIGSTPGAILYRAAGQWVIRAPGTNGLVLTMVGGLPAWEPLPLATTSVAGVVIPDGTTITVDPDGTIHSAGSGGIGLIGTGVPTTLEPAGTLWSRDDAGAVYSSQPIVSGSPAIVQSTRADSGTTGSSTAQATLTNTPVAGNLLVAFVQRFSSGSVNADWTVGASQVDNNSGLMELMYHYVLPGDGKSWTFTTATSGFWNVCALYELSGVSGVWATDFTQNATGLKPTPTPYTTTALTTAVAGQLALIGFSAPQAGTPVSGNVSAGWTLDQAGSGSSGYGTGAVHQAVPASGTTLSLTVSAGWVTAYSSNYIFGLFGQGSGSSTPNWDLIGPGALPTLTSAHIFVGNGSNVAADVAVSGDASLSNTGALTVSKSGGVAFGTAAFSNTGAFDAAGAAAAAQAASIPTALTSAHILVGNGSNVAASVSVSGDASLSNTGALTVSKSGGVAFGTAAFANTGAFDAAGAAAAAQAAAIAASDPVGSATTAQAAAIAASKLFAQCVGFIGY